MVKMLNYRPFSQSKSGFTLVELLLWICLFSILFMAFFSVLEYVNNVLKIGDREDEILSSARYGIEYIKSEILAADKIIPTYKFEGLNNKYPNMFDFVILTLDEVKNNNGVVTGVKYNYTTYYLKNDELTRIAINKDRDLLPKGNEFAGHNQLSTFVLGIDGTKLMVSDKLIKLKISMGDGKGKDCVFKTKIHLNCPIDL